MPPLPDVIPYPPDVPVPVIIDIELGDIFGSQGDCRSVLELGESVNTAHQAGVEDLHIQGIVPPAQGICAVYSL